jgi:Flp pilus assembly protein TadG
MTGDQRRPARPGDRGRVSVLLAGLVPLMLLFIALVWDASSYLRAVHRAENIASEAARAAGQAIDLPPAMRGEQFVVDPHRAVDAAASYLADVGAIAEGAVIGDVVVSEDGRQVTVTVHVDQRPLLITPWRSGGGQVTGQATANLIDQ